MRRVALLLGIATVALAGAGTAQAGVYVGRANDKDFCPDGKGGVEGNGNVHDWHNKCNWADKSVPSGEADIIGFSVNTGPGASVGKLNLQGNASLGGGPVSVGLKFTFGPSSINMPVVLAAGAELDWNGGHMNNYEGAIGNPTASITMGNGGTGIWTAGTLQGELIVPQGAELNIEGSVNLGWTSTSIYVAEHQPVIRNVGTINWKSGNLIPDQSFGALIENKGIFRVVGTGKFVAAAHFAPSYFRNEADGVFHKSALNPDPTDVESGWVFENAGQVQADAGSLRFTGGTYSAKEGGLLIGPGRVLIDGGIAALNGLPTTLGTANTPGFLELKAGTLTGNGSFVTGGHSDSRFYWTGGMIEEGTLTVPQGFIMEIDGAADKLLGRPISSCNSCPYPSGNIVNAGTVIWNGSSNILPGRSGGSFHNQVGATLDIRGDAIYKAGGGMTVTNDGRILKTGGTGVTTFQAEEGFTFNQNGLIDVRQGVLSFKGGHRGLGLNMNEGSTFTSTTGNGVVRIEGGTTAAFTGAGTRVTPKSLRTDVGQVWQVLFPATEAQLALTPQQVAAMSDGFRPYTAPGDWGDGDNASGWVKTRITVPDAWLGRDLVLYDFTFDDDDKTYWNGDLIGATKGFAAGRRYSIPARLVQAENDLVIMGTDGCCSGGVMGNPTLYVADETPLLPRVHLAGTNVLELAGGDLAGKGAFDGTGSLHWTAGAIHNVTRIDPTVRLNLTGVADKRLWGQISNGGTVAWSAEGKLLAGGGSVFHNHVGATFDMQGDAQYHSAGEFGPTFINDGTVVKSAGAGDAVFASQAYDTLTFHQNGTLDAKQGKIRFQGGVRNTLLHLGDGSTLTSSTGNGMIRVGDGTAAFFPNTGPLELSTANGSVWQALLPATPEQQNLTPQEVAGMTEGFRPYTAPSNWRSLTNQDNMYGWVKTRVTVPEAWVGKDLLLYDWNFDDFDRTYWNGELIGKTNIHFARRSYIIPGAQVKAVNDLVIRGFDGAGEGGIHVAPKLSPLPTLRIPVANALELAPGGSLNGVWSLAGEGSLNWTGGAVSGVLHVPAGGQLFLTGAEGKTLVPGSILSNAGTVVWSGAGGIHTGHGITTVNNTGTFIAQGDAVYDRDYFNGNATFNNTGTFVKSGGTGTTVFHPIVVNDGTVRVETGTLQLGHPRNGGHAQYSGVTELQGGTLAMDSVTFGMYGGAFTGVGNLKGSLYNEAGVVNPGAGGGYGLLTVEGNYTQAAPVPETNMPGGTLALDIGPRTDATPFDRFAVTGTATFGGGLATSAVEGFGPSFGDTFAAITYGARAGDFHSVSTQGFPDNLFVRTLPDATGMDLTVGERAGVSAGQNVTAAAGPVTATFDQITNPIFFGVISLLLHLLVGLPEDITPLAAYDLTLQEDFGSALLQFVLTPEIRALLAQNPDKVIDIWHLVNNQWIKEPFIPSSDPNVVLTRVSSFSPFVLALGGKPPYPMGDADLNRDVNVADAVMVLRYIVQTAQFTEEQVTLADVDKSQSVDVTDAVQILRKVVGLPTMF